MFERLTPPARQVVLLAQEEGRALGHNTLTTDHLLIGLLRADGAASRALGSLGLTADRARDEIVGIVGTGRGRSTHGQLPFNPRTRRVLDQALRESMSMGGDEIGTEHLLLGLVSEREGAAAKVLAGVAEPGVVRDAVLTAVGEPPPAAAEDTDPQADAPDAVSVRLGGDVRALLRRAAGHALADEAPEVGVDHVRKALDP